MPRSGCATSWAPVLALLALGASLRFAGIGFGLPLDLRPDEATYWRRVAGMAATQSLDPGFYIYPGLAFHLDYAWLRLCHVASGVLGLAGGDDSFLLFLADRPRCILLLRCLAALCGSATLLVTWRLGVAVAGRTCGLLSMAFLAVAFLHVRDSHFGVVDAPFTLATTLSLLFCERALRSRLPGTLLLAALLGGIASALKYPGALLGAPLVGVAVAWRRKEGRALWGCVADPRVWLAALVMIAGFAACSPFTLISWDRVRSDVLFQLDVSGSSGRNALQALEHYGVLGLGCGLGWPLVALAGLGLLATLGRGGATGRPLALFCGVFLAAIVLGLGGRPFVRYVLPLLPPMVVLGAAILARGLTSLPPTRAWIAGSFLLPLLLAPPLWRSCSIDRLFLRETSFERLRAQLERRWTGKQVCFQRLHVWALCGAPPVRLAWWDPQRMLAGEDLVVVGGEHPHPRIGRASGLEDLRRAGVRFETLAEIEACSAGAWEGSRYEEADFFFFPLDGFSHVERGGPTFRILSVAGPASGQPANPPAAATRAPRLVRLADLGPGRIRLAFRALGTPAPLGFRLHLDLDEAPGRPRRSYVLGLSPLDSGVDIAPLLRLPGRYHATLTTVTAGGEGPPSPSLDLLR